jgi:hypothetical protein
MNCCFIKPNKTNCHAQALKGKELCFTHDPDSSTQRQLAHRNGGLARQHYQSYLRVPIQLKNPKDIQALIEITLNSILCGNMPANNPGNTIGFLSHCWLDAYEKGEIHDRLSKMEEQLEKFNDANTNKY